MQILIVEDEKKVLKFITQALSSDGMAVVAVTNLEELLVALKTSSYDVIILDRLLGTKDSLESLSLIRSMAPKTKVLVLSALSEVEEKVHGLSEGADDYLGKPFHISELIARIRALTRRSEASLTKSKDTVIEFGDLKIDLQTQRVERNVRKIELTAKEYKLLCLLARHPGQVFTKTKILDEVWEVNHLPESNVVEVTIANLRAKIDKGEKPLLQSRRGVGYWFGEK